MPTRALRTAALAATLLLTAGCLESSGKITLKTDGSGTWRQTTSVHMAKVEALLGVLSGQMRELEPEDDVRARHEDAFPDLDIEKRKKQLSGHKGIELLEASATRNKARKIHTTVLEVRFDSLKALFESGAVEDAAAKLEKTKEGRWKLTIRHAHLDAVAAAAERLKRLREGVLEQFKPYWGDLAIDVSMELPTKVISTNGRRTGQTVTWQVRFADLADPKKLEHEVTFEDAKNLELAPFSVNDTPK